MTIRDNYCPSCEDICNDHPRICSVCGTSLTSPPAPPPRPATATAAVPRPDSLHGLIVPRHYIDEIRQSARALSELLRHVHQEVEETRLQQRELMEGLRQLRQEFESVPLGLLDPSNGRASRRPTAQKALQDLPRICLETNNSLFLHPTSVSLISSSSTSQLSSSLSSSVEKNGDNSTLLSMEAVPGEFGVGKAHNFENMALIVAEPRTGKGGALSLKTMNDIQRHPAVIVYMERGDDVTFVQKALLAQKAGAHAVIIGNNVSEPWPYVMRDSKKEAVKENLTIPVVMVKQSDGRAIVSHCSSSSNSFGEAVTSSASSSSPQKCSLLIQAQAKDCVICADSFHVGQTLVRLPACGHIFHETCALQWLEGHNTCPYCRRELPTDDADYERERLREQRTHAGSRSSNNPAGTTGPDVTFYG